MSVCFLPSLFFLSDVKKKAKWNMRRWLLWWPLVSEGAVESSSVPSQTSLYYLNMHIITQIPKKMGGLCKNRMQWLASLRTPYCIHNETQKTNQMVKLRRFYYFMQNIGTFWVWWQWHVLKIESGWEKGWKGRGSKKKQLEKHFATNSIHWKQISN